MNSGSTKSARAIENEVEQTRSQVSSTLEELRNRMAPGAMVDSMVSYAGENGAADFLRTLGNQVRANPLPVTLIGAGIAWLAIAGSKSANSNRRAMVASQPRQPSPPHYSGEHVSPYHSTAPSRTTSEGRNGSGVGAKVAGAAAAASDMVSGVASSVRSTTDSMGNAVSAAYETAQDVGSRIADGAATATDAVRSGYRSVHSGYETAGSYAGVLKDQPLISLALGVAIGAAIGAALPATDTENEYLGATSDLVKERAKEVASEQYRNVSETAGDAMEAVKSEIKAQGLTADAPKEALADISGKVGAVANAAKAALAEGAERSSKAMASAIDEPLRPANSRT